MHHVFCYDAMRCNPAPPPLQIVRNKGSKKDEEASGSWSVLYLCLRKTDGAACKSAEK